MENGLIKKRRHLIKLIKQDSKLKSAVKSVIWRICGVIILAAVTYFYTHNWITTGLITLIHHGVFLFVFYFHERI